MRIWLTIGLTALAYQITAQGETSAPLTQARAYIIQEANAWYPENNCYSCHNHGDAVRALLLNDPDGTQLQSPAWDPFWQWLADPKQWMSDAAPESRESPILVRIQFGALLAVAQQNQRISLSPNKQRRFIQTLSDLASSDGYWAVEPTSQIGSPVTYGNPLATAMALGVFRQFALPSQHQDVAQRAATWIIGQNPRATVDLAAGIRILNQLDDAANRHPQRSKWSSQLVSQQQPDGGWGPYPRRASEVFDTAITLIALSEGAPHADLDPVLMRGQNYLRQRQEPEGGWPETTRPAGGNSYAQHISTSAWAFQALAALDRTLDKTEVPSTAAPVGKLQH